MIDSVTTISDERLAEIDELVSKLNHLVSLDRPENGGPYQGLAARECLSAMQQASDAIQSLRAQGGVRVKAQKWREEGKGWFRAPSELGAYNITHYAGMKSEGFKLEYGGGFTSYFSSLEEAKAAAQADYERRILSALETLPTPVSEGVTDQMVEIACKVFIPHWEACTEEVKGDVFGDMRSALTAALATKGGQ